MVLSAERKRLAWRPARHEIDFSPKGTIVQLPHVAFPERPSLHGGMSGRLVCPDRRARMTIPVSHKFMTESRLAETHAETAGPHKQLNRLQLPVSPRNP